MSPGVLRVIDGHVLHSAVQALVPSCLLLLLPSVLLFLGLLGHLLVDGGWFHKLDYLRHTWEEQTRKN